MKKFLLFLLGLIIILINPLLAQISPSGPQTTPTTPATLPYSCNFEDPTENANWEISNGTATNKFFINPVTTPTAPIAGNALFISSDNGVTPSYNLTSISVAVASRTIQFNGAFQYQLNFDVHIGGESSYDYIKVYIVDVDTTYTGIGGSTPYYGNTTYNVNQFMTNYNGTAPYFNGYNGSTIVPSVYPKQVMIPNQGSTNVVKKLIIVWRNDGSGGTVPPAIIDNISLTPIWCPAPTNIVATNTSNNSTNLSWTEIGSATLWNLEYKLNSASVWTEVIGLTTPNYVLNSLDADSIYNVRVKSNCGTELSPYSNMFSFTTLPFVPATLPYSQDFENPTENAEWKLINGTQTNKFYIGDATQNPAINNTVGGANALYISNDGGSTWAYSGTGSTTNSWVYAYRDFVVPTGVNELKLDFDWIANGGVAASEFLRVYWMPTSIPITAGSLPPTINSVNYDLTAMIGNYTGGYGSHWLSRQTTWQHATFSINTTQYPTLAGNTWRLYVHWRNNQTTAVQPPATFDNMTLVVSNCPTPRIDSINNMTQNTADINFSEFGSSSSWNIQYRILGTTTWSVTQATVNPFTLSALQPSSSYEVRMQSDCSSEQSSWSPIKKFNTTCGTITQIPWVDYFDNYGTGSTIFPACWTRKSNLANTPYITTTNFSAPASMYFYCGTSGKYANASTPMIDASIPINTLMLNFRSYFSGADDTLYVGTMTNPLDSTTFTEIAKFSSTTTASWINQVLYLNTYQGTDQYITFRTKYGASASTIYIDNLQVLPLPTCLIPNTLSSSNVTAFEATINWLPGDINQSTWWIYYKPAVSSTWDSVQVFAYPYILTNLAPSTNYQYYMKTDCGSEFSEATNIKTFMTQCIPVSTLPWNDGFESITAAATLPPCWAATSFGSKTNTQIVNYGSYNRNARTGSRAAYFVYGCNDRFFTPGFQLTAGVAYKFSYWYVTDGLSGWTTLQSGVYSAQNAGGLIQTSNTINGPTNTTYQEVVTYFTPTTDGIYYFGVYCQSTSSPWYITLDDFSLDLAPDCLPVQQLAVTNIVGTSAYASWIPAGTPDSYTVELSETGTGVWSTFSTTTPNFVLSNLTELTNYSVQVYPICSGVEGPRDTVDFTTICAAGGDLIIGNPNATTSTNGSYFPTYLCYNYSYTQQIFDVTEITADTIFNIAFQYFYGTADTRNLTIYLGHTTQSTFTGTTNFVPFDSLTQVFQGNVNFTNVGLQNWVNITFTTPFDYNESSNLVLAVRDMTGTYNVCAETFRTHATTGNKALYFYQDTPGAIDPVSPTATYSNIISNRNNIKINLPCETVACYTPNVILTDVTSSSASLIIVPGASETSWEGEYKASSDASWTTLGTVTSPYVLPALNSNTTYSVRFRAVCSVSDVSSWKSVTFTTDCGTIETLPFVENFDTYGQGTSIYPTCWTRNSTAGAYPYISTTPLSSPYSLYFYSTSTAYSMIVLPPLDPSFGLDSLQLTFWGRISTAGYNLKVGVMTNPNDASTFTLLGTVAPSVLNAYEELTVSFANYTDTGRYIAIRSDNIAQGLANNMYIDNLTLGYIPNCVKPTNILFTNIMQTTATGFWTPSPSAVSYEVVYGLPGVDPLTATPIAVNDTFYDMTSLTANTLYHFYVRSVCAGGEFSDWTFVRTFRTACDAIITLPWSDYFDTYGTGSTIFPQCWTRNSNNGNYPYIGTSPTPVSAPGIMYFYAGSSGNYNVIATPMFDATIPINTLKANFKYRVNLLSDTLYVGVMTDPLNTATFVQIAAIGASATAAWQDKEVLFNNYTGTGQYIAFRLAYNTTYAYSYMDNLEIMDIPTCPRPNVLTATNPTTTTMTLGWTETGTATAWEVEYGIAGFTQGTGTIVPASTNPYILSTLLPSTTYDFYVRAICGVGDTSYWSVKATATTACIPFSLPITEGFEASTSIPGCWSTTTTAANYNIISSGTYPTATPHGGANMLHYNSFSISSGNHAVLYSPLLNLTGAPVIVSYWQYRDPGYDTYLLEGVEVFYNTNASLTGATSLGFTSRYFATAGWYNITYTIPAGLTGNAYIMFKTNSLYGNNQFVDDISLTYAVVSCPIPTNLAVTGVTTTTATASWTAGGTETQWEVAYKPTAASTWMTTIVNTTPSYVIPSLTANTAYDVKVRAICGAADSSVYTPIVNFTTTNISCATPTNLAAVNISNTGATINWTAGGTETAWEVDYKLASATTWITVNATTASQALTALSTCSDYNVRVRAVCGVGIYSSYTAVVNFSTLSPVPTNLQVTNITDQGALATWTAGGTETSWQIEYKLVSSANWASATVNGTPSYPLTNLQSSSLYEVRVKSLCSPNASAFTTPVQFTTLGMTFTINATAGANGTITPSGIVTVNQGANQTFTFAPNTGYVVDVVTVDGTPIVGTPASYTFNNILANHTINVDFTVGIEENELAQLVELFPNPTTSIIELRLKSDNLHVKECKVFDMYGKLMRVIPIDAETTSIDVTDFASGVYFVRMDSERGTISKKFVKK